MTTQETYNLANELTEKEISNVLNGWANNNEEKTIATFESLVKLGDSRALALATTIAKKYNSKSNYESYYNTYCI